MIFWCREREVVRLWLPCHSQGRNLHRTLADRQFIMSASLPLMQNNENKQSDFQKIPKYEFVKKGPVSAALLALKPLSQAR